MSLFLGPRWLGVRIGRKTRRGRVRLSVGPRLFRLHLGSGGDGISTGAGPVSYYSPLGRRRRRRR
jgi:hypothetical protein